jgi:hypothetical protein
MRSGEHHVGPRGCDAARDDDPVFDPLEIIAARNLELSRLQHELENQPKPAAGPWVSVEDGPPKGPCVFLVWRATKSFSVWQQDEGNSVTADDLRFSGFTHWSRLTPPEAP